MRHEIGHLPFQADVTNALKPGAENRVTVLCDNTLLATTLPQGDITEMVSDGNASTLVQNYTFDFFNYAGIHRSVHLYTTPTVHIKSVVANTSVFGTVGRIGFRVEASTDTASSAGLRVRVLDRLGDAVADRALNGLSGHVDVYDAHLWWPYLMDATPGYLYTLEVHLLLAGEAVDVYRLKVGIRTLHWTSTQVLLNGKPLYLRGFGRHEDSDVSVRHWLLTSLLNWGQLVSFINYRTCARAPQIRGKGFDLALLTRDINLLHWSGANAYRTSHYPYSEESMQFADEAGIMVIAECPAVDVDRFSSALQHKHKRALEELIVRDRNHASVIMWSISNEARSAKSGADEYFGYEWFDQYVTAKLGINIQIVCSIC